MEFVSLIGLTAATLTTLSALPQIYRVIQTRMTHDISLLMYIMLDLGVFLWLVYGLRVGDLPLILANSIGFVLNSIVLVYKVRYG